MRLLALCALGLVACAAPSNESTEAEENVGRTASAIIGSKESTAADDAVVALGHAPGGRLSGLCTGTLIAPNLVLTARHCVSVTDENATCTSAGKAIAGGNIGTSYAASDLYVYRGVSATIDMRSDGVSRKKSVARGKALVVDGSKTYCNADLAFLVLDRDVAAPCAPVRTTGTTKLAELVSAVGYGLTSAGTIPSARQKRAGIPVLGVGPLTLSGLGGAELLLGESSCSGDSGGPIFGASGAVIGVVSRGGGGTGAVGNLAASCIGASARTVYTHVSAKSSLLALAYSSAGHAIWSEGTPAPWVACTAGTECSVCSSSGDCMSVAPAVSAEASAEDADDADAGGLAVSGKVEIPTSVPVTPDAGAAAKDEAPAPVTVAQACALGRAPGGGPEAPVSLLLCLGLALLRTGRRRITSSS